MEKFENGEKQYRIISKIADGQFGPVYVVENAGVKYVAKTYKLPKKMCKGKVATKLYYEHTNYKYKLNSPQSKKIINTPYMHDYFIYEGLEVLILTKYKNSNIACAENIAQIAVALISTLETLHKTIRLIHFDIKPANLLFQETLKGHRLILLDFDNAQPRGTASISLAVGGGGTPKYRSINQVSDSDTYCDLESAAYTLLAFVSKIPWSGDDKEAKLDWIFTGATKLEKAIKTMAKMAYEKEDDYDLYYALFEKMMTPRQFIVAKKYKTIIQSGTT